MYLKAMSDSMHYRYLCMPEVLRDRFFLASDEFQRMNSHLNSISQRWLGMRLMWLKGVLIALAFIIPISLIYSFPNYYLSEQWEIALSLIWSFKVINHLD